ncbi:MAG: hypothetical protein UZ12_BCD005001122 [Bacteroidetes bacterium OLB12]|nr:MAG: hypothetical protein UZ12_BCD005001122 [Bacteroidetes bacterium OLB12]
MKTFLLLPILLITFLTTLAQRTEQFGNFRDKDGIPIKGSSFERGYERQIQILNLQIATNKVTTVRITIPNTAAVAAFQNVVNTKWVLQAGDINVLSQMADQKKLKQKITMTSILVKSVTVTDESAVIELVPQTFNQTFYEDDKNSKKVH